MISITQDSEFMLNLLAANPIPAGKQFKAIKDAEGNPAVFSLGEDSILNLIISQNGTTSRVDFGGLCEFSGKVIAFDVQQNIDDSLCIVVACDAGTNLSDIYFLVDLFAADLLAIDPSRVLFAGGSYPVVYDILLSSFLSLIGTTAFPMTFLVLAPPGALTQSSQLGYLNISYGDQNTGFNFSLNTSWRLATDPISILSVTFGQSPVGNGAFVLYTASDGNHLQFCTFDGNEFASEMACPMGATSITSYINFDSGYTELLVGGAVITQFTYRQYCIGGGVGTTIVERDSALEIKSLRTCYYQGIITMWYTTLSNAVFYYTAQVGSLAGGQLIPLLENGQGEQISTVLAAKEAHGELMIDTLLAADGKGNLSMLQCPSDTGIWQSVPFYAPSDANNIEVPSFTLRFSAASNDATQPVQGCQLHIASSGAVQVTANGATAMVDTEGAWYQADQYGVVTLIVSTSDMASFTFQVDKFQALGADPMAVNAEVLNPNGKLNERLASIQTADDLLYSQTQTGELLILPGTVTEADASEAASAIQQLTKQQMFHGRPGLPLKRFRNNPKLFNPKGQRPVILAGVVEDNSPGARERFLTRLSEGSWYDPWGIFNWCYDKAADAISWAITQIDNAIDLVMDIAGTVYKFVLDGVESIGKAISWVFENLKVGVKKLIQYVGFLFNWGDILDTSDSIAAFLNAGLEFAQGQISDLKTKEQQFMASLRNAVNNRQAPETVAAGTETKDSQETPAINAAQHSVAYNWVSYQVTYGGMASNGKILDAKNITTAMPALEDGATLQDIWNDLSNIWNNLIHYIVAIGNDVGNLFTSTTTSKDAYERLQNDLINAAIDTTQDVLDLLIDALSLVLGQFQELCNKAIQLPIFTSLWKAIAGGRDFTVLNAFSLLLAIPATVVYKAATNSAPPSLKGMDANTFAAYINGSLTDELSTLGITRSEIRATVAVIAVVATGLQMEFNIIKEVTDRLRGVAAETVDTGLIFLGVAILVSAWPVSGQQDMSLRFIVWGLDCSNVVALATARFISWKTETPRSTTAPAVATWAVMTSIPSFIVKIIINTDSESGDPGLLARHITEDTLTMIKTWFAAIGEVVDDVKVKAVAKILGYACTGLTVGLKFVDFYIAADDAMGMIVTVKQHRVKVLKRRL